MLTYFYLHDKGIFMSNEISADKDPKYRFKTKVLQ